MGGLLLFVFWCVFCCYLRAVACFWVSFFQQGACKVDFCKTVMCIMLLFTGRVGVGRQRPECFCLFSYIVLVKDG